MISGARLRWLGFALGAVAVGYAVWALPLVEWLTAAQQRITAYGSAGAAWYPVLVAACNLLLLPGGMLSVGAGFLYGLWWGFALVLVGNVAAAGFAMGIARAIGRERLSASLLRRPRWAALDRALEREGWKVVVLSQLNPLFPTSLINYLYGLTRLKILPCMGWVALGQVPGLFLYAYLGTLGQRGLSMIRGESHPGPWEYVVWIGGFGVAAVTSWLLGRLALRMLKEVTAAGELDKPVPSSKQGEAELPRACGDQAQTFDTGGDGGSVNRHRGVPTFRRS